MAIMTLEQAKALLDPKASGRSKGRPKKEVSEKLAEARLVVKAAKAAEDALKAQQRKQEAEAAVLAASQPKPEPVTSTAPEATAITVENTPAATVETPAPVATGN